MAATYERLDVASRSSTGSLVVDRDRWNEPQRHPASSQRPCPPTANVQTDVLSRRSKSHGPIPKHFHRTPFCRRKSDHFVKSPQNVGIPPRGSHFVRYLFSMHSKTSPSTSAAPSRIEWEEKGENRSALWHSESGIAPPRRVVIGDDQMTADSAYRLACEGTAILWRGDFQNARQLLQAVARRIETRPKKSAKAKAEERSAAPDAPPAAPPAPAEAFNLHRLAQSQRAPPLGMLLLPLDPEAPIPLRPPPVLHKPGDEPFCPPPTQSPLPFPHVLRL